MSYRLSAGVPEDSQRVLLEAVGVPGLSEVSFWVDGELAAQIASAPYQTWWELSPGVHQAWVTAVNAAGEQVRSEVGVFTVETVE